MQSSGLKQREIITTPFSFIATANSILLSGCKPVFVDIEQDTCNIDPERIKEAVTDKTKAIMPVHLYGNPCEMKALMDIAEDKNLLVFEDACQSHGAKYGDKMVGSFGKASAFSLYPTKNMMSAEGGIITTDDDELAERARRMRNHGQSKRYHHSELGYNYRLTDLAAAIGIEQLKRLDKWNKVRIENAERMTKLLDGINGLKILSSTPGGTNVFHQYTIRVTEEFRLNRDELVESLLAKGIQTGVYYPIPIHLQAAYAELGYGTESHPLSEAASKEVLSLPIGPHVTEDNLRTIAETIKSLV